jgi:hypothetical protein
LPNWYIERRAIAVPTRMFSLVASSMKPSDAITGILRSATSCGVTTPERAAEVVGMAVREDQRRDRLVAQVLARKGHRRGRALAEVSASTTIQPVLPSISVMLEMSKPRSWCTPSRTLNRPTALVQRGVAPQAGVDGGRRLAVDELVGVEVDQHVVPSAAMILPSGAAMKPRLASSKSCGSARLSSWAISFVGFLRGHFGVAGGAADAGCSCRSRPGPAG